MSSAAMRWVSAGAAAVGKPDVRFRIIRAYFDLQGLGLAPAKLDRFVAVRGNPRELLEWLVLNWLVVGLTEELISRAFLIDQWQDLLPAGKASTGLAVTLSALTFSAVHFYQGWTGLISNFVAGLLFGALYVLRGRTLASNVIAHAPQRATARRSH